MTSKYYQMLNDYDRTFMDNCIHEAIFSFNNYIIAYIPLPEDRQRNFDKDMREYTGPILFYKKIVLAERIELVQDYNNNTQQNNIDYGRRDDGKLAYSIPNDIPVVDDNMNIIGYEHYRPSQFDIFEADGEMYYVSTVKNRIGQYVVIMSKYDGTTPNGIDKDNIIVLDDTDEIVMEVKDPLYKRFNDIEDYACIDAKDNVNIGTYDEDISINTSTDDVSVGLHDIDDFVVSAEDVINNG